MRKNKSKTYYSVELSSKESRELPRDIKMKMKEKNAMTYLGGIRMQWQMGKSEIPKISADYFHHE